MTAGLFRFGGLVACLFGAALWFGLNLAAAQTSGDPIPGDPVTCQLDAETTDDLVVLCGEERVSVRNDAAAIHTLLAGEDVVCRPFHHESNGVISIRSSKDWDCGESEQ